MKKLILTSFCLLFLGMAWAQPPVRTSSQVQGDRLYQELKFMAAIPYYRQAAAIDSANVMLLDRLSDCYVKVKDPVSAEQVLRQLVRLPDATPDYTLRLAEVLHEKGAYDEANILYKQYIAARPDDQRVTNRLEMLGYIDALRQDSLQFKLFTVDMNSSQPDFSPAFYGKGLLFVSGRTIDGGGAKRIFGWTQSPFLDIYQVDDTAHLNKQPVEASTLKSRKPPVKTYGKAGGTDAAIRHSSNDTPTLGYVVPDEENSGVAASSQPWVTRISGELNSIYHEGPLSVMNEDTILFTRNNYHQKKYKTSQDGTNRLKIYQARKVNGVFADIKPINLSNDEYSIGHPALSPDHKTLYFVSDMPGGKGQADLYISKWVNNEWSAPVNMGAPFNTEGNEMFPYVDERGNLYFSSDGHGGLGALDVFMCEHTSAGFDEPENLGYPINSSKDDFGVIYNINTGRGYFSSNRRSGSNDDDIYYFSWSRHNKVQVDLVAQETNSRDTLRDVSIQITDMNTHVHQVVLANRQKFHTNLEPGHTYQVVANRPDHSRVEKVIATEAKADGQRIQERILFPGKINLEVAAREVAPVSYAMPVVHFAYNQSLVTPEEARNLDQVLQRLNDQPEVRLLIRAYTDSRGPSLYNLGLSQRRADAVAAYLVNKGLNPDRIHSEALGEANLLNTCADGVICTEEQHSVNRRAMLYAMKDGVMLSLNETSPADLAAKSSAGR